MAKRVKVVPIEGWILVGRENDDGTLRDTGDYTIAWYDVFSTKKRAVRFMRDHNWPRGYLAVRGRLGAV